MPKIDWSKLPRHLRDHLIDRSKTRGHDDNPLTLEDLRRLGDWVSKDPNLPDGPWVKDFGSFKLVGRGKYPSSFLQPGQPAKGDLVEVVVL